MNKKNKRLILSLLIFGTILIGIGFSYAFFTYRNRVASVEMTMGDLSFKAELGSNSYTVGDMFPMTLEDDPYSNTDNYVDFSLISNNPLDVMYATVKLIEGDDYPGKERIDDRFLHFSIKDLDNNTFIFEDRACGLDGDVIFQTEIEPSTSLLDTTVTRNFRLYVWVGDELIISDTDPLAHYKSSDGGKSYLTKFSDLFCSFGFEIEGAAYDLSPETTLLSNINELHVYFGNNKSSPDYSKVKKVIFAKATDEYVSEYEAETYAGKKAIVSATGSEVPIYALVRFVGGDDTNREVIFFSDNVIKMPADCSNLFKGWSTLSDIDFTNADFSDVTNLNYAFNKTVFTSFTLPKIKNLTKATYIFSDCQKLEYVDFSNVDNSSGNFRYGFYNCIRLEEVNWGTMKVSGNVDLFSAFQGCKKLKSMHLENFDFSRDVPCYCTFSDCNELENIYFPSGQLVISNMYQMFYHCWNLRSIDLSNVKFTGVNSCNSMFLDCRLLEYIDVSGIIFQPGSNSDTSNMFQGCTNLKKINFGDFGKVGFSSMNSMFYGCTSLTEIDLSNFNFSNLNSGSSFNYFCYNCTSLEYLTISNFSNNNLISFSNSFYRCTNLKGIGFINCNIKVKSLESTFKECNSLEGIDLSCFDTSECTSFNSTFAYCTSIQKLNLNSLDFSSTTSVNNMLNNCTGVKEIIMQDAIFSETSNGAAMKLDFSTCTSLEYLNLDGLKAYYSGTNLDMPKSLKKLIMRNAYVHSSQFVNFSSSNQWLIEYVDLSNTTFDNIQGYSSFFYSKTHLTTAILNGVSILNREDISNFFDGCSNLTRVEMDGFSAPSATDLSDFFNSCSILEVVDFSWFHPTLLYNFNRMFNFCTALKTIYASCNWDSFSAECDRMFYGCTSLVGGTGYAYVNGNEVATYATTDFYLTKKEV